jgi:hypothetical protein
MRCLRRVLRTCSRCRWLQQRRGWQRSEDTRRRPAKPALDLPVEPRRGGSNSLNLSEMSELDDFLGTVIPRYIEVEKAFSSGDVEPRLAMWTRTQYRLCERPAW